MEIKRLCMISLLVAYVALFEGCGPLSGDVKAIESLMCVNEFMASNADSAIVDEFGETEDWVELFNADSRSFSLAGLYLSDDSTDLLQYALPDTTIPAYGYYLVWLDNNPEQGKTHAPFKLSATGGEEIILAAKNGYIIDRKQFFIGTAAYGEVLPNKSYGRENDGAATWVIQKMPTPGLPNAGL